VTFRVPKVYESFCQEGPHEDRDGGTNRNVLKGIMSETRLWSDWKMTGSLSKSGSTDDNGPLASYG
jgi:hypothetical protein